MCDEIGRWTGGEGGVTEAGSCALDRFVATRGVVLVCSGDLVSEVEVDVDVEREGEREGSVGKRRGGGRRRRRVYV